MERDITAFDRMLERKISTHTLTWSVTVLWTLDKWYGWNFNSHAHVERDGENACLTENIEDFNSHAHVERDLYFY